MTRLFKFYDYNYCADDLRYMMAESDIPECDIDTVWQVIRHQESV